MKLNLLFLFLTSLSFAQTELHHFEISTDIIWYDANGNEIIYDSVEHTFNSENSFMDKTQIKVDGVTYQYNDNIIELEGVIYKFRKPLFDNAVYLTNMGDDKDLIIFKTSPMNRNAYQKIHSKKWLQIDDQKRKILYAWAQNQQVEYAFNVSLGTSICGD